MIQSKVKTNLLLKAMESEEDFGSAADINEGDNIINGSNESMNGSGEDINVVDSSNKKDALNVVFNNDIRPLIDLIDKLRRYGIQQDVELPNVVVVGDQSSGKSSIIEALSGVQLPRGKGIVTRCPLELQLKRVLGKPWRAQISYWNKRGQLEQMEIFRSNEVEEHVRKAQNDICGIGYGISDKLITLRLESPDESAPDLTLIDLPGIARLAIEDQPENVCEIIHSMIMKHVSSERTVILCVISANLDLAVNESLRIARTVDPQGERTIGVITKPDASEESHKEDVLSVLSNEKIKLQKGFTMVKCRSQPELENNVSLKESIKNEKEFFENDRVYRKANRSQLGTMNLAKKISEELVNVIRKSLPELKEQIEDALQKAHKALDLFAESVPTDYIDKQTYLTKIIWNLNSVLKECLNEGKINDIYDNNFYNWRQLFTDFLKIMQKKTKIILSKKFSVSNLTDIIKRSRGRELPGFLDFDVFKSTISTHVKTYENDAFELLKKMSQNVEICIVKLTSLTCNHLPEIEKDFKEVINCETKKIQLETGEKIKFIFQQESIIFTMDAIFNKEKDDYQKRKMAAIAQANKTNQNALQALDSYGAYQNHDLNPEEMQDMIKVYLNVVNHRLSESIPLTIMQCLLMELSKRLESRFLSLTSSKPLIEKLKENETLVENRKNTKKRIERLQKANREISRF